jgi:hypothetical protein
VKKKGLKDIFKGGKHDGKTVQAVIDEGDKQYIMWLWDNERGDFYAEVFRYIISIELKQKKNEEGQ